MASGWNVTADPGEFHEALDWFKQRVPGVDTGKAGDRARGNAFRVAGILELDAVQTVFSEIGRAVEKGTTLADFKARVREKLGTYSPQGAHLETVFRNWTQTSYNAGRYYQMSAPDVARFRPYWMYDTILDDRTTEVCRVCNGTVKLSSDSWWDRHWPPQHHRCRSSVRNLRASEAVRRGITETDPAAETTVPNGWGKSPKVRGDEGTTVDKVDYDASAWDEFQRKQILMEEELKRIEAKRKLEDPGHWLAQGGWDYQYDRGVAGRLAWGKAAYYRGLHMDIERAEQLHGELEALDFNAGLANSLHRARQRGWLTKEAKTLEDAISDLEAARHSEDESGQEVVDASVRAIRAGAAVVGHMDAVSRGAGPKWNGVDFSADFPRQREAEAKLDAAQKFYVLMTDASVRHHKQLQVRFRVNDDNGDQLRAYCDADGRAIGKGQPHMALAPGNGVEVYIHEYAHALEESARIFAESGRFIDARTQGEQTVRLRDLFPRSNYSTRETTKRDKFTSPYIGKQYRYSNGDTYASEVLSMALQNMYERTSDSFRDETELFWYALGQLAGKKGVIP